MKTLSTQALIHAALPAVQGLCFWLAIALFGKWIDGALFWNAIGFIGASIGFGVFTYRMFTPRKNEQIK